eukprot:787206-Rhodomonas_salina.1
MPCGGGGFAGGGPGCGMRREGKGVRQVFSGWVPGRSWETGVRPGGAGGAVGVGFGAGGAGGL